MPDFTQYVPPGVYVEEEVTPLVSVVGVTPSVVGIVGPAIGYRQHTEVVVLNGATPVTLSKAGINIATGFEVRAADGSLFTNNTDYDLVQAEIGVAGAQDNLTTITRDAAGTIVSGTTLYVSYRYTDTEYGQPFTAQDYDTVKEVFGEPINLETGAIISPLALAAKIAFENGAARVVLVATPTPTAATREELQTGLAKLDAIAEVNIVVPLPVGQTGTEVAPGDILNIGNDLQLHVEQSTDDRVYRVGVIGFETSVTTLPVSIAASIGSDRVMLAWPNRMLFYNGYANQLLTIAGYYLAAGYAGRLASQPPQMPLTKKQIRGFSGIPADVLNTMTTSLKNTWSQSGVAVVEFDRQNRLQVRHGVTTLPTSVMSRELSLVRARDSMMQSIADTVDASGLVGSTIDIETPARVKGVVQGCLETLVGADTIVSYQNLKVRQQSVDPTVIEVKFQYQPAYPLNYITVSFSVNALTGELGGLAEAA